MPSLSSYKFYSAPGICVNANRENDFSCHYQKQLTLMEWYDV